MTTFLQALQKGSAMTRTENGAVTNSTSHDPVVDFFGLAGAMRNNTANAGDLFEKAYRADPLAAVRTLFYLRDIRGGQGERAVFREGLKRLAKLGAADAVLKYIPEYGRWDDIFYSGANLSPTAAAMVREQLEQDLEQLKGEGSVSLLAKWLPSVSSRRADQIKLAISLQQSLGLSQRKYRKMLSALRGRIGLLETNMSGRWWREIDFGKLPGQAHRRHVKAFRRHLTDEYQAYLDAVDRGEAKINTGTTYPYELYELVRTDAPAASAMWQNLPDYTRDGQSALVMADVSGSMYGRPMSVSVSLALYFAERNTGPYKGYFMTFASEPALVKVGTGSLASKFSAIEHSTHWCGSTSIGKAFAAILKAARVSGEAPSVLYVVSDMEFDMAINDSRETNFEDTKQQFAAAGVELPHVVFWNVNARSEQLPATVCDGNVTLVSGLSPTVFGMAVENKSPRELVDSVINGERYAGITL